MARSPDPHPIAVALAARGWTLDDLVAELARCRKQTSIEYLRHILARRKRPSYGFAQAIAAVLDGVAVEEIMSAGTRADGKSVATKAA